MLTEIARAFYLQVLERRFGPLDEWADGMPGKGRDDAYLAWCEDAAWLSDMTPEAVRRELAATISDPALEVGAQTGFGSRRVPSQSNAQLP